MDSIDIDYDVVIAACDNWEVANSKLSVALSSLQGNPFASLCSFNPDLGSAFIKNFTESLNQVLSYSKAELSNSKATAEKFKDNDSDTGPSSSVSSGSVGGGGSSGGSSGDDNTAIEDEPVTVPVVPPDTGEEIDATPLDTSSLNEIELNAIDEIVTTLKDLSVKKGQGIDEVLISDDYADEIKAIFLSLQFIPDEFKQAMIDADSKVVMTTLLSIMKGENPEIFDLNSLNLGVVYSYLEKIALEHKITVEELLSNPLYSDLLKDSLSSFEDTKDLLKDWESLSSEDYQKKLLDTWDGNEVADVSKSAMDVVRDFVGYISDETSVDTEELLVDTKYADVMKQAGQEFSKTSAFIGATAYYSEAGMREVVGDMLSGKNAAALGMDSTEVTGFKNEIDSLASSKGVSSSSLLSSSSYADDVRNLLDNSTNASGVGSIYKNSSSSTVQNVARNLYETNIDATPTAVLQ